MEAVGLAAIGLWALAFLAAVFLFLGGDWYAFIALALFGILAFGFTIAWIILLVRTLSQGSKPDQ